MPSNKQYVIKKCSTFTRTQNLSVLNFLIEMGVISASDGSRVNLDKLSKKQLTSLKRKIDSVDVPIDPKFRID